MVKHTTITAADPGADVCIEIALDDKGKALNNAGAMTVLTNEIVDVLRKHYNAHQIKVEKFSEEKKGRGK